MEHDSIRSGGSGQASVCSMTERPSVTLASATACGNPSSAIARAVPEIVNRVERTVFPDSSRKTNALPSRP